MLAGIAIGFTTVQNHQRDNVVARRIRHAVATGATPIAFWKPFPKANSAAFYMNAETTIK
jgi:hypothetical protein